MERSQPVPCSSAQAAQQPAHWREALGGAMTCKKARLGALSIPSSYRTTYVLSAPLSLFLRRAVLLEYTNVVSAL